jgi:hypothetical protein
MVAVGAAAAILLTPLTFVPGCELMPPRISSHYTGPGRPVPRDRSAHVDIFLAGHDPERSFVVLGDVEVHARSRNTSLTNMFDYARGEARKLGGDAVVEVRSERETRFARGPCAGAPTTRRTLTGTVVRW